jgi:hypothetical protein
VIVSGRPGGHWSADGLEHVQRVTFGPLDDEAVTRLAIKVSATPLGDADIDVIRRRAQGNALFAIELVRGVSDPASNELELPDSIEQIIAGRIVVQPERRSVGKMVPHHGRDDSGDQPGHCQRDWHAEQDDPRKGVGREAEA